MTLVNGQPVLLHLYCNAPPPQEHAGQATEFGLQDKQASLHPGLRQIDGAQLFVCEVLLKQNAKRAVPDFSGSFVHGPLGSRFLYLGWRPPGGAWIRRWKITLPIITPAQFDQATRLPTAVFEASIVEMKKATVPLIGGGWNMHG